MQNILETIDFQSEKIGQRLKQIRHSLEMTVEEFYSPLMKAFNNGSAIENNKRKLGKRLSKDIIEYHHINPLYLSTGKGEMLLNARTRVKRPAELPTSKQGDKPVPYYDLDLMRLGKNTADIFSDSAPEYYVDYRPLNDCTAYLPVYGDSMCPRFANGEIIAVKEVRNLGIILWGEAYLVVTDERTNGIVTVRSLHPHKDEKKIILRAHNPAYGGDTIIDKASIKKLYIIKGKITRTQL